MTQADHEFWAKQILAFLVKRVINFKTGYNYLELAKLINYPEPHDGNSFASNIGTTLETMGDSFNKIVSDENFESKCFESIPLLQALVVSKADLLPGTGFEKFAPGYLNFSKEEKEDFIRNEYHNIFSFGKNWLEVCKILDVKIDEETIKNSKNLFNPFGSGGSPEHRKLRDYIATNPSLLKVFECEKGITEYPLKSGDKIDVLFEESEMITAVEVKPKRSGYDDIERGIYQCIKYQAVLIAENKANNISKPVHAILVTEDTVPDFLKETSELLGITLYENIIPVM